MIIEPERQPLDGTHPQPFPGTPSKGRATAYDMESSATPSWCAATPTPDRSSGRANARVVSVIGSWSDFIGTALSPRNSAVCSRR